jgi:predicted permease
MRWLLRLFRKELSEKHLDDELRFHLERQISDYIAAGTPAEEARRRANLDFGGLESIKQETREAHLGDFLDTLAHDIRFGLRTLRKSPGFTTVAILTLALGIGANTAIFSLIDAVMLRSLPVPNLRDVVLLRWVARRAPNIMGGYNWEGCPKESGDPAASVPTGCSFSYHMYQRIHTQQTVFSGTSAFIGSSYLRMKVDERPVKVCGEFVGGDFFSTLGLRAELGRMLDASDDAPGAEPVAVLRYGYWQNQFGSDPAIIGRHVLLENNVVTIIGVAPPAFTGLNPGISDDVWLPLSFHFRLFPDEFRLDNPANTWAEIVARLKPEVTRAQAESAITAIFSPSAISAPDALFKPDDKPRIELPELAHGLVSLREEFSESLFVLMAAVGLILLIASANIAGLMLSRAASRQREIAVRLALGARRQRILRQLFTESLMVVIAASALGILLAYWGASSLAVFLSANWYQPLQIDVHPDPRVLGFTAAIATFVGVFFGLAPSLRTTRVDLTRALKGSAESVNIDSRGEKRSLGLGSALVIAQVALSMVVLVGAGLLVHTLVNLQFMNVGFDTRNILLLSIDPNIRDSKDPRLQYLQRDLQARLASIPGVLSASYSMVPLLSGSNMDTMFQALNTPIKSRIPSDELPVGTRFFETMHIELLGGRTFNAADFEAQAKPRPVIVNQMLACLLFGETNPNGQFFSDFGSKTVDYQVIGLVADAKYAALRSGVKPTAYLPLKVGAASFELRTVGEPKALIPAVRAAVSEVNSNVLITEIRTQTEQIDRTLYQERLLASLSSLFGVLALGLACIGLYGLLAYEVTLRTHEIGVRMALGALQCDVLRLVVWRGLSLAAIGAVIGVAATVGLTRYLETLLYGVRPVDPATLAGVATLLFVVAIAACYIPARRATRVDPMVALRYE